MCIGRLGCCQCGDVCISNSNLSYCCIPPNVTCKSNGYNSVDCPFGKALPLNLKCDYQESCPTSATSNLAVTTNCNHTRNSCGISKSDSSKICTNSVSVTSIRGIENACENGIACPEAQNGPKYQQCYKEGYSFPSLSTRVFVVKQRAFYIYLALSPAQLLLQCLASNPDGNSLDVLLSLLKNIIHFLCRFAISLEAFTCLSRRDPNKDIFMKVKKKQKRRNFYNMVDIKDGMLICQEERYLLDKVCVFEDNEDHFQIYSSVSMC